MRSTAYAAMLAISFAACGPDPAHVPARPIGYVVLSEAAIRDGFRAGDTLPEWPASALPERVVRAARAFADESSSDPACTRFFGRAPGGPFVVLTDASCGARRSTDMQAIAVLTASGRRPAGLAPPETLASGDALLLVDRPLYGALARVCPALRDSAGGALGPAC